MAFEHFIFMEIRAHRSLRELNYAINFWRTKSGLEADFVLGDGQVAIEVKGTNRVERKELRPLRAFRDEYAPRQTLVFAMSESKGFMSISESCRGGFFCAISGKERLSVDANLRD